jgi:hypothetical protein
MNLYDALDQFNRTEPDLLFRDAFGHSKEHLRLSHDFRSRVADAAGLQEIPETAWWAAEYPFNCLAGAILLWAKGSNAAKAKYPCNASGLITSGREDVDFVIAFDERLIMIEAKVHTSNATKQVKRKLERLRILHDFYCGLPQPQKPLQFHFVLASPTKPQKFDDIVWPDWACKRPLPWTSLHVNEHQDGVLRVTRCDEQGNSNQDGKQWRIVSGKSFKI